MKLPNRHEAIVSEEKITGYLLSDSQHQGRHKAAFFRHFGFSVDDWQVLAEALRAHVMEHEVARTSDSPHGIRYTVEGELTTPQGRRPLVRTVWIVDHGTEIPRLVSAYPLARRSE
jgi:hypothetical protein